MSIHFAYSTCLNIGVSWGFRKRNEFGAFGGMTFDFSCDYPWKRIAARWFGRQKCGEQWQLSLSQTSQLFPDARFFFGNINRSWNAEWPPQGWGDGRKEVGKATMVRDMGKTRNEVSGWNEEMHWKNSALTWPESTNVHLKMLFLSSETDFRENVKKISNSKIEYWKLCISWGLWGLCFVCFSLCLKQRWWFLGSLMIYLPKQLIWLFSFRPRPFAPPIHAMWVGAWPRHVLATLFEPQQMKICK